MSSRAQDADRLAQLARQLQCVAATNVQLVNLIEEINTSLRALTSQVNDLAQESDDLDRRILALESQEPAIRRPVVPNVVDSDYDDDYGAYIRG